MGLYGRGLKAGPARLQETATTHPVCSISSSKSSPRGKGEGGVARGMKEGRKVFTLHILAIDSRTNDHRPSHPWKIQVQASPVEQVVG